MAVLIAKIDANLVVDSGAYDGQDVLSIGGLRSCAFALIQGLIAVFSRRFPRLPDSIAPPKVKGSDL